MCLLQDLDKLSSTKYLKIKEEKATTIQKCLCDSQALYTWKIGVPHSVMNEVEKQTISYPESLPNQCFTCGFYGRADLPEFQCCLL